MGEERSSTWPTVIELAVTPGEGPVSPDAFGVDVTGAAPELADDVGVELDLEEQEASPTASTHNPARAAPRGLTSLTRAWVRRERASPRFTSTPLADRIPRRPGPLGASNLPSP